MTQVGIVGCGRIAERHLNAYRRIPDVRVSVTDVNEELAARRAASHAVDHVPSLEAMLASDIDAIDVCVPNRFHAQIVIAAVEAGKHVFCEKPLCVTTEEAEDIRVAGEKGDVAIHVGYLYRYHPAFQFAKRVIDDGVIGVPHLALFRLGGRGSHASWQHDGTSGGGAGHEMLVHMLDLAMWLLGDFIESEIHAVRVMTKRRRIENEEIRSRSEDFVLLSLVRPGMRTVLEADFVTPSYMNLVEVHGDGGSLFTSILHYLQTIVFCTESRDIFNQGNNFFDFPQTNLFELELGEFVDSIRSGRKSRASVDDAIRIQWVLDRVSAAAQKAEVGVA